MNVQTSAWRDPRNGAHPDPPQVHPKLGGGKNGQVPVLVESTIHQKKKENEKEKEGPVLERGGGGSSDGGRNRWTLDRRKTRSIRPFLWTEKQVFREERPSAPQPTRTSTMSSLLFPWRQKQPKPSSERRSDLEHVHAVVLCLCVLGGVCLGLAGSQSLLALRARLHQRRFLQRELFIAFWQVLHVYDPVVSFQSPP